MVAITTADIRAYIASRQAEGAANATINRELSMLKRMFSLAIKAGLLHYKPNIPLLQEHNVSRDFSSECSSRQCPRRCRKS
jgi:site-specific recombinase XerD